MTDPSSAPHAAPLHVLSIATLFPDAARPNFGLFVERSLRELARQPGIALTIVAPVGIPPWPLSRHARYRALAALPPVEDWNGVTVHRPRFTLVPRFGARTNPGAVARAVLPIARALPRVDVIDAQFFFPDGPAAMRVGRALDRPWSIKARGADISHWGHAPASRDAVRAAAAGAGGMLAVSAAMVDDMAAIGIDRDRVRVHYTGVDGDRFHPGDRAGPRAALGLTGPAILTVGAVIPRKGQELVLRALPALPEVTYLIAGAGEDAARLAALAQELGVADRVRLLGPVANASLPELYRAADVVVMPSVSEGLANAWVEALACGTPIVISDAGGAAELVTHPDAGRIVAREPAAIGAAVRGVLEQRTAPERVAATLGGRFDWARNGAELADHLRSVAATRAAR